MNDRDLTLQYQAFYDTSPENEAYLNQWVEKSPKSYPARLARGIYYASVGKEHRSQGMPGRTPPKRIFESFRVTNLSGSSRCAVSSATSTRGRSGFIQESGGATRRHRYFRKVGCSERNCEQPK